VAHIGKFITDARAKGLADDKIRQALIAQGWDPAVIDMGLAGLEVPTAETGRTTHPAVHSPNQRASLSPLLAALHHILLWFFTGSSIVTIAAVIASLYGTRVSTQALTSMIAVTIVAFTPYAVLFIIYLRKLAKNPELAPGWVWSIITVCIHSIGALISAITLIVALINNGDRSVITSASLILALNLIVVVTYLCAAFAPRGREILRKIAAWAYLPLLVILFGSLFIMSVLQLGPARHDEQLRKNLVTTVRNVATYTQNHGSLPENGNDVTVNSSIEYHKKTDSTYQVCAVFKTNAGDTYSSYATDSYLPSDDYVSESQFYAANGRQCFDFRASSLRDPHTLW